MFVYKIKNLTKATIAFMRQKCSRNQFEDHFLLRDDIIFRLKEKPDYQNKTATKIMFVNYILKWNDSLLDFF